MSKPKNQVEWSAYRLKLTVQMGFDDLGLCGKMNDGNAQAFHNLFRAIGELGTLMMEIRNEKQGCKSELPANTTSKIHRKLSRAAGESMGGEA